MNFRNDDVNMQVTDCFLRFSKKSFPITIRNQSKMNTATLFGVFSFGVLLTVCVSFFATYLTSENFIQSERAVEHLIASKRRAFELSQSVISIPEESQLTVVSETESLLDIFAYHDKPSTNSVDDDTNLGKNCIIIIC